MAFSHLGDELERELAHADGGTINDDEVTPSTGRSGRGRGGRRGGSNKNGSRGGRGGGRKRKSGGDGTSSGGGSGGDKLSSPGNPQVKALIRLRHRRARDQEQLTIIEEPMVIRRAWETGYPLQTVYHCKELLSDTARELLEDLRAAVAVGQLTIKMVELSPQLLRKAAYRESPDGLLAVAPQQRKTLEDLVLGDKPFIMVLENVEKPGNLGAVLRIADGVGADAVLLTGEGTDLFNPNVLRASRGAFFATPAVHCQIGEARDFLHDNGLKVLATTPSAEITYTDADLTGPMAVVLGCEHDGLSEAWLKDEGAVAVKIPMQGHGDSLNVSTAAAVLMYEALRQRSAG